jgi:hypothetical protein
MRAQTVERRLLSLPRRSVGKVRFEADELGGGVLVLEVAVRGRPLCSRCGRKWSGYDRPKPAR